MTYLEYDVRDTVSVSIYVDILANSALRAHHASAHGGVSTNGLSDMCLIFFGNDSIELLEIMSDGRAFHSLAVDGKQTFPDSVGRVYTLKKLAAMFT